jgi:DNA excision repair protein ERCC-6
MKFWHYRILHTPLVGEDGINLTVDDSDPQVFQTRNAFIRSSCEPYVELFDISNGLKLPRAIWQSLFPHQRLAVEWLWSLWQQRSGGIEGDEMGLGKTAIACVFISALVISGLLDKPTLVLCPLTVAQQWIRELHTWAPQLRAILLHDTRANKQVSDEEILDEIDGTPSVLVTNYESLYRRKDSMTLHILDWGIVICDEGHKIRNHSSGIAKLVKRLTSDFRLAISGSPIQNSLVELWSLFDFAVPGLLGSLDVFERDYADPIKAGGYSSATAFEVFRAYTSAVALRDMIRPYLLRRMKRALEVNLPGKTEQIFFVKLTHAQERAYTDFLDSSLCRSILDGSRDAFIGIDHLRKICDHPALLTDSSFFPSVQNSAKLVLLNKILPQWHRKGHRALLFSQYLKMLDFTGQLLESLGLEFFRIDGETPTARRQQWMDRFNSGDKFACLLSTKVGGVGVNLTGADRVVIIDPDWNPATDNQALERAFRIGQTKDVSVYRLISVGTIEEKMYKKQIFKQFLSNRILQDPTQKRLFKPQTLRDLFRLESIGEFDDDVISDEEGAGVVDDDKELMQSLCGEGDIQHVFHHDSLFDGQDLPERQLAKSAARQAADAAKENLRRSVFDGTATGRVSSAQLISRIRDHSNQGDAGQRLTGQILEFFRGHGGTASTSELVEAFGHDPQANANKSLLREILRRVAVLNKKTHLWHLMNRFKPD